VYYEYELILCSFESTKDTDRCCGSTYSRHDLDKIISYMYFCYPKTLTLVSFNCGGGDKSDKVRLCAPATLFARMNNSVLP
jgi:hypothetical protein